MSVGFPTSTQPSFKFPGMLDLLGVLGVSSNVVLGWARERRERRAQGQAGGGVSNLGTLKRERLSRLMCLEAPRPIQRHRPRTVHIP